MTQTAILKFERYVRQFAGHHATCSTDLNFDSTPHADGIMMTQACPQCGFVIVESFTQAEWRTIQWEK